jgi:site-specific recombinase XerD
MAREWLAKKPHESAGNQQLRITLVRQFSKFLLRLGYSAYVPDSTLAARNRSTFVPRLLTDEELRKFFQAVDALEPTARSPLRHLIMPEVFRLLYGCGFRVNEVLKLRVRDIDLYQGIIHDSPGKVPQRSVGSPRDQGSMTLVTGSPSMPYDAGIETARIWMPNFLFWPPTSGM